MNDSTSSETDAMNASIKLPAKCPTCSLRLNHEGPCKHITRADIKTERHEWNPEENEADGPWNEPEDRP